MELKCVACGATAEFVFLGKSYCGECFLKNSTRMINDDAEKDIGEKKAMVEKNKTK